MPRSESVVFNGVTYRRYPDSENWADRMYFTPGQGDKAKGYQRLHQEVWKAANGCPIPEGFHIHHKDENPLNNDPSNLECIPAPDHGREHASREKFLERLAPYREEALAKAAEWHRSEAGYAWHSEHGKRVAASRRTVTQRVCEHCGREYETADIVTGAPSRFCSNYCKHRARLESGVDDETRACELCGTEFRVNKYLRKRFCTRSCATRFSRRQQAARRLQPDG